MNYTDKQLKVALAKMLPKVIQIVSMDFNNPIISWVERPVHKMLSDAGFPTAEPFVRDTELLHLCKIAWDTLDRRQRVSYGTQLREAVIASGGHAASSIYDLTVCCENATWQQRVIALAKMKGFEI